MTTTAKAMMKMGTARKDTRLIRQNAAQNTVRRDTCGHGEPFCAAEAAANFATFLFSHEPYGPSASAIPRAAPSSWGRHSYSESFNYDIYRLYIALL